MEEVLCKSRDVEMKVLAGKADRVDKPKKDKYAKVTP